MKDKKKQTFGRAPNTSNTDQRYINGVKAAAAAVIRKKNATTPQQLLLLRRQLREYFLYFNLKSLLPSPPLHHHDQLGIPDNEDERAAEVMELDEPHECLVVETESDDKDRWGNWDNVEYEREDEEEEDQKEENSSSSSSRRPKFVPSVKIQRMEDSIQISTVVEKEVSLTSTLFALLEEEKLDIVFENQYRTETKVAHTIQVRVQPGYDTDGLEKQLRIWAGYSSL